MIPSESFFQGGGSLQGCPSMSCQHRVKRKRYEFKNYGVLLTPQDPSEGNGMGFSPVMCSCRHRDSSNESDGLERYNVQLTAQRFIGKKKVEMGCSPVMCAGRHQIHLLPAPMRNRIGMDLRPAMWSRRHRESSSESDGSQICDVQLAAQRFIERKRNGLQPSDVQLTSSVQLDNSSIEDVR